MIKLDINAKQWYDKVNRNSYFSAVITIDKDEEIFIPFQYGYGSQYLDECKSVLTEHNKISCSQNLSRYCQDNSIEFTENIKLNCKKIEL
jgi:hypothetical protein